MSATSGAGSRDGRRRLALAAAAAAAVAAVALLGAQIYRTLARSPAGSSERLRLKDDVETGTPPPAPDADRDRVRDLLLSLGPPPGSREPGPILEYAGEALKAGDALAARAALLRAVPKTPEVEEALARCESRLGLPVEAARRYERLSERAPGEIRHLLSLGRSLSGAGRGEEALRILRRAAGSARSVEDRLALAAELREQGDLPGALEAVTKALSEAPESTDALIAAARIHYAMENLPAARPLLERALARDPENSQARYYLALVVDNPLAGQRDPGLAEHLLLKNVMKDPADQTSLQRLGEMYQDQGRHRAAAHVFVQLLHADPDLPAARLQLARAYRALGDIRAAEEQERIGQALLVREREAERLGSRFRIALRDPGPRLALGRLSERHGQWRRALAGYQSARAVAPGDPRVAAEVRGFYRRLGVPTPLPE